MGEERSIGRSMVAASQVDQFILGQFLKSPIFREHLCYENAGHMFMSPLAPVITEAIKHPLTGLFYEVGGEPEAQAFASKDSWHKTCTFLSRWSR
jgi:hypothetical protein